MDIITRVLKAQSDFDCDSHYLSTHVYLGKSEIQELKDYADHYFYLLPVTDRTKCEDQILGLKIYKVDEESHLRVY